MTIAKFLIRNEKLREILLEKFLAVQSLLFYRIKDMFYEVEVETITECNLRCRYCPNSRFDRGLPQNRQYLPENLFKKLIDDLSMVKTRIIRLSPHMYGEPLLDNRLPDLISYAHTRLPKICIAVFTNGICLSIELYKKLVNAGVREFVITEHTSKMLENVREIIEYNKNEKNNVFINYRGKLVETSLGNRGGLINTPNAAPSQKICRTPSRRIVINYKGDVLLCCDDYFGKHVYGNIAEENVIKIWKKPSFRKIRKELLYGIWNLEMCRLCKGLK